MSRLWDNAVEVLENASAVDGRPANVAVLLGRSGDLRIVMAEGWSPEGLRAHYGASAVYRVSHSADHVCVEGRGEGMSCTLRGPRRPAAPFRPPVLAPLYRVETRKLLK